MSKLMRPKAAIAAVGALVLAFVGLAAQPASAAVIPGAIDLSSLTLTGVNPSDPEFNVGDRAELRGNWSVPDTAQGGDTFSLTLPVEFRRSTQTFNLSDSNGTVMGTCAVSNTSPLVLTCTLSDVVNNLDNISGGFFLQMTANSATTETTGTFSTPEGTVEVTFPGGNGIIVAPPLNITTKKSGSFSNSQQALLWQLEVSPADLASGTVTVTDTLGAQSDTQDAHTWTGNPAGLGAVFQVLNPDGTTPLYSNSLVTGGWAADGKSFSYTINSSAVPAGSGLRISYYTEPDDGNYINGEIFGNTAVVNSTTVRAAYTYAATGGGTGSGNNFGRISFSKAIEGNGVAAIPAGTEFTVSYTVNGVTTELPIAMDGSINRTGNLPQGAVVTLSEVNLPAIAGYEWATPVFTGSGVTANGDGTYSVTVLGNGTTIELGLTNSISQIVVPPAPRVSVGDYVWVDLNRDGIQDSGEPGIPGVTLTIVDDEGNPVVDVNGNPVGPVVTDENGYYTFENLPVGVSYTTIIDQDSPALDPYTPTKAGSGSDRATDSSTGSATSVVLPNDGDRDPTLDYGFVLKSYTVGDYTWIDSNKDGIQDSNEPVLPGVKVTLYQDGEVVDTTTTDENGYYQFDELPAGEYQIRFELTEDQAKKYEFTPTGKGTSATDSNAGTDGWTSSFVLDDTNTALVRGVDGVLATEGIDPTWDAGVVLKEVTPNPTETPTPTPNPSVTPTPSASNLARTGGENLAGIGIAAGVLLLFGAGVFILGRKRNQHQDS